MFETNCYNSNGEKINSLTQWDLNQTIRIKDLEFTTAPLIHFYNENSTEAFVVNGTLSNGTLIVDIPNCLLQQAVPLTIYLYEYNTSTYSSKTIASLRIPVKKKVKPSDYTYVENITSYSLKMLESSINTKLDNKVSSIDIIVNNKMTSVDDNIASKLGDIDRTISDRVNYINTNVSDMNTEIESSIDTKFAEVDETLSSAITNYETKMDEKTIEIQEIKETIEEITISRIAKCKNIITVPTGDYSKNNVDFIIGENNHISIVGNNTSYTTIDVPLNIVLLDENPYTFSVQNKVNNVTPVKIPFANIYSGTTLITSIGNINSPVNSVKTFSGTSATLDKISFIFPSGSVIDFEADIQLEIGETSTPFEIPSEMIEHEVKIPSKSITEDKLSESVNNDFQLLKKQSLQNYTMTYLYVSNDYVESDTGFGIYKFNRITDANDSITDSSKGNRYTILVADGIYNEWESIYAGNTDTVVLQGIITKNYVYYESISNDPKKCILSWDGAIGYDAGVLTNAMANMKCIFHVTGGGYDEKGMNTHIKGFTISSKNTRYGIHKESGTIGRNVNWTIKNCIIEFGNRPDVADGTIGPIIGMGMSPHEVGIIEKCEIRLLDGGTTATGIQCHNNIETLMYKYVEAITAGAKLLIRDCNLTGKNILFTTSAEPIENTTNNVATIDNCINVSTITSKISSSETDSWTIKEL